MKTYKLQRYIFNFGVNRICKKHINNHSINYVILITTVLLALITQLQ